MTVLLGDRRAALVNAGAEPALADKAAAEVATYETRLGGIETRLVVLTWMVGAVIGLTTAVLIKLLVV